MRSDLGCRRCSALRTALRRTFCAWESWDSQLIVDSRTEMRDSRTGMFADCHVDRGGARGAPPDGVSVCAAHAGAAPGAAPVLVRIGCNVTAPVLVRNVSTLGVQWYNRCRLQLSTTAQAIADIGLSVASGTRVVTPKQGRGSRSKGSRDSSPPSTRCRRSPRAARRALVRPAQPSSAAGDLARPSRSADGG